MDWCTEKLCGGSLVSRAYAGRISTTELVNMIYNFCEVYSGKVMYAYQTQFSKRIIRSVLENDGAEITALFSRQSGKTETIAITVGGLMIILPEFANMPMFADDPRLSMFKDGFWVGIFAPSQRQAQITYNRMKARLQCKESVAVLNDPDFRLEFTTSNGQTVALSNGSFCTAISASDGSNIEGESFKFIICEECFVKGTPILTERGLVNIEDVEVGDKVYSFNHTTNKVELKKVVRSFSQPLYGRKIVKITTKSGKTITCTDNHKIFIPKRGGYVRADHLQIGDLMLSYNKDTQESEEMLYDEPNDFRNNARGWKHTLSRQEVLKKSEVYSESVSKTERVRVGQVQSCETPMQSRTKNNSEHRKRRFSLSIYNKMFARGKRVLQSILQKRKESDFEKYTGLNDRRSTSILVSRRRKFFWNDVYSLSRIFSRRKRDFSRLANREVRNNTYSKNGQENKQTISVLQRDREEQVSEVNTSLCDFNNEIQNSHNRCGSTLCSVWENDSSIQTEEDSILFRGLQERTQQTVYEELLQEEIIKIEIEEREEVEVFDLTVEDNHNFFANSILVHNCQDISNYKIQKSIHPMGAAYNATICKIGTATTFKGDFYEAIQRNKKEYEQGKLRLRNHFEYNYKVVMKYNPKYAKYIEREKRSLGETSDAFRMSYNLEWIISRGMFIDLAKFEKTCGDKLLNRVSQDHVANHTAGIDVGGGSAKNRSEADSTVVTVTEVDWNNPVLMETSVDEESGEDRVYLAFNTYIKDWYEISPEIADDYEEQYQLIMDYLKNFRISRLVVDSTREASLGQRIRANVKFEVIPFVFSTVSKSQLYKHLQSEINTGRARFPMGEQTVETKEYKKFTQQMADLQKSYSGSNLVVSHPTERGAHDDYPDSWALAVWGAKDAGQEDHTETMSRSKAMGDKKNLHSYVIKNRRTARRR